MARKKAEAADAAPGEPQAATTQSPGDNGNGGNGGKAPPPVYKCGPIATDRDNSVEAAVWARQVRTRDDREFTVYSVSVQASWRDTDGSWKRTHGFRGSQIYALLYCLQRCSDWILAQRDPGTPV